MRLIRVVREIRGFLYGTKLRMILPCVVSIDDKARWVFFIVTNGSPLTYISSQVSIHPLKENALVTNLALGGTSLWSQSGRGCSLGC
jgi:hypothetical protein